MGDGELGERHVREETLLLEGEGEERKLPGSDEGGVPVGEEAVAAIGGEVEGGEGGEALEETDEDGVVGAGAELEVGQGLGGDGEEAATGGSERGDVRACGEVGADYSEACLREALQVRGGGVEGDVAVEQEERGDGRDSWRPCWSFLGCDTWQDDSVSRRLGEGEPGRGEMGGSRKCGGEGRQGVGV